MGQIKNIKLHIVTDIKIQKNTVMEAKLVVFLAAIGVCMAGIPREMDKRSPRACAAPCPSFCAPACQPVCCVPAAPPPPPPPCPAVCVQACVPSCPPPCCPQKKH